MATAKRGAGMVLRRVGDDAQAGDPSPPYYLLEPLATLSPAIFSSPHSGRRYPPGLLSRSRLDSLALRASEDAYVDVLFESAPAYGAPLLAAAFPRAYVDANRSEEDLDPALIEGVSHARARNPRVAAGLGVIPRVVAEHRPIYDGKLTRMEARDRIVACHRPYHEALGYLVERARQRFGRAILFDCHSMPSEAVASRRAGRADVILGDCHGGACGRGLIELAEHLFRQAGFSVSRNAPFAGGYITQRYGRPRRGVEALQIEIDRALYLDEARIAPAVGFDAVKAALSGVIGGLARTADPDAAPIAAE